MIVVCCIVELFEFWFFEEREEIKGSDYFELGMRSRGSFCRRGCFVRSCKWETTLLDCSDGMGKKSWTLEHVREVQGKACT